MTKESSVSKNNTGRILGRIIGYIVLIVPATYLIVRLIFDQSARKDFAIFGWYIGPTEIVGSIAFVASLLLGAFILMLTKKEEVSTNQFTEEEKRRIWEQREEIRKQTEEKLFAKMYPRHNPKKYDSK